ncbi:hypothetical protein BOS5A_230193 [Bosea sp. EC-HK365B]|nr:hypothetical protein BOSE21B_90270 [Bosea sp. 21B]CAD5298528.1 hypothetical protein BOSE7B_60395 [Bosea sp. 7B]VVT60916.1 hypothetical protein BOS5A_230193 [Bosea sp. EC-HK365B]VXB36602.1 hypothetical protein BOSE127_110394 [Bosea sp. 127]
MALRCTKYDQMLFFIIYICDVNLTRCFEQLNFL